MPRAGVVEQDARGRRAARPRRPSRGRGRPVGGRHAHARQLGGDAGPRALRRRCDEVRAVARPARPPRAGRGRGPRAARGRFATHGACIAWRAGSRSTSRIAAISNSGEIAKRTRPRSSGRSGTRSRPAAYVADSGGPNRSPRTDHRADSGVRIRGAVRKPAPSTRLRHRRPPRPDRHLAAGRRASRRLFLASMAGRLPGGARARADPAHHASSPARSRPAARSPARTRSRTGSPRRCSAASSTGAGRRRCSCPPRSSRRAIDRLRAAPPRRRRRAASRSPRSPARRSRRSARACARSGPAMLGDDPGRMHAAFSLEAAALEATYIVGPGRDRGRDRRLEHRRGDARLRRAAARRRARVLRHAASRAWRPGRLRPRRGRRRLRSRGVRTLMLVFALLGATFGSIEIAVPVAAEAAGPPARPACCSASGASAR